MSHFTVLVITDERPDQEALEAVLQPWHEYECTGIDDEYVIDVDVTDELIADHAKYGGERPFDEFVAGWSSAEKRVDGRWYRHTNPNAKWDWWQVGGRWTGMLRLKEGAEAILGHQSWCGSPAEKGYGDSAELSSIDLQAMRDADEPLRTFAVVKDGQWFERGKMGWWAAVADDKGDRWTEEFDKLLADLPPSAWLTVVDCHI